MIDKGTLVALLSKHRGKVREAALEAGVPIWRIYDACSKFGVVPARYKTRASALVAATLQRNDEWQDIDWSDAPIAKKYGIRGTNFYGMSIFEEEETSIRKSRMNHLVKIISGPEGYGQGTKVMLPDGSVMEGVSKITASVETGKQWKAVIECWCEVELEAEVAKPVAMADVTSLDDEARKYALASAINKFKAGDTIVIEAEHSVSDEAMLRYQSTIHERFGINVIILGPGMKLASSRNDRYHGLDTPDQVFFYEQEFYCLSNFSAFAVHHGGVTFSTSEHAYQAAKFDPLNSNVGDVIAHASSAHAAYKIAQDYKSIRRPDWDEVKVDVMKSILHAKVSQHEYVKRKLLETSDRVLIENSWRDDYWGWGPNRDGQNMLGKLWMEIRKELYEA